MAAWNYRSTVRLETGACYADRDVPDGFGRGARPRDVECAGQDRPRPARPHPGVVGDPAFLVIVSHPLCRRPGRGELALSGGEHAAVPGLYAVSQSRLPG